MTSWNSTRDKFDHGTHHSEVIEWDVTELWTSKENNTCKIGKIRCVCQFHLPEISFLSLQKLPYEYMRFFGSLWNEDFDILWNEKYWAGNLFWNNYFLFKTVKCDSSQLNVTL